MKKINLAEKFQLISKHWSPRIIAELNGQHVKIAKVKGEFEWHKHVDEDELFLVVEGNLRIETRSGDGVEEAIELSPGEIFVVPRGLEHRPIAKEECQILMFEPVGTLNTGNVRNEFTLESPEAI